MYWQFILLDFTRTTIFPHALGVVKNSGHSARGRGRGSFQRDRVFNKAQTIFMFATTFGKDKVKFKQTQKWSFLQHERLKFVK